MKIILQPKPSMLCGQCCVAMVANISLEKAINAVGSSRGTHPKHLRSAFRRLGVSRSDKMIRGFPAADTTAVLSWQKDDDRRKKHWVVWHNNKYYDPMCGVFRKVPKSLKDWHVTSYMRVIPHEDV